MNRKRKLLVVTSGGWLADFFGTGSSDDDDKTDKDPEDNSGEGYCTGGHGV